MYVTVSSAFLIIFCIQNSVSNPELLKYGQIFPKQETDNQSTMCGIEYTDKQFLLQSPNYPENYPPNIRCDYILRNPINCPTYFKFDFLDFRLQNSVACLNDRLVIENQDALCGRGPKSPQGNSYFSENGVLNVTFISDDEGSALGFKILVTRMECEDLNMTTDGTKDLEPSTTEPEIATLPFRPFYLPSDTQRLTQCCSNIYNSRRFLLTSPNFPTTLNTNQECAIKIQKSSDNICRLRLNFLYFYLGSTEYNNCPYGYLKIDGKFICGCNKDLKLTTTFEQETVKTLVFKSDGVNINSRTGFVIEVVQDECPTKYYPANRRFANIPTSAFLKEDQNSYISNQQYYTEPYIEQAQLIHQRTEISDPANTMNSKFLDFPRLIKTFYYFGEPDYNTLPVVEHGEKESTTFIDTSTINSIVTNFNTMECINWNKIQLDVLLNQYGRNVHTCLQMEQSNGEDRRDRSNCIELDHLNGYIKSPGYPFYYPKNLNTCYRFRKQTGYCGVKLFMADFQLQNSFSCNKDYVLLENGNRYCGKRLFGQYLTFDLTQKYYTDVIFVTDKWFCGRGFYGLYNQIPCQQPVPDYPDNPVIPTTTTTTPRSILNCDRYITDQAFVLQVDQDAQMCTIHIRRLSKSVCKINLNFEKFDLYCGSESLVIENMMFCGHLLGRKISVNFDDNDLIQIVYRSTLENKYEDFKFKITGEQITDDCLYPEPPVQRFLQIPK